MIELFDGIRLDRIDTMMVSKLERQRIKETGGMFSNTTYETYFEDRYTVFVNGNYIVCGTKEYYEKIYAAWIAWIAKENLK